MRLPDCTPVRGLLRCLDAGFFITAFEEEGYHTLGNLREYGEEEVSSFVGALSMPRGLDRRLLAFAYAADSGLGVAGEPVMAKVDAEDEDESPAEEPMVGPAGLTGCSRAMDPSWLRIVDPLYSACMGVENMGPFLYSLLRFIKPKVCLEIGAGYTSAFLLQALEDNQRELDCWRSWKPSAGAKMQRDGWLAPSPVSNDSEEAAGVLHCVDNLAHAGTTAHLLLGVAEQLGLEDSLRLHLDDARAFVEESEETVPTFDFVWLDGLLDFARPPPGGTLGDGIDVFLSMVWPRVAPGGFVLLHSTLTNSTVRRWLQNVEGASWGPPGAVLSLLEPHKKFQNSVSLFQKRPAGYAEPTFSKLP